MNYVQELIRTNILDNYQIDFSSDKKHCHGSVGYCTYRIYDDTYFIFIKSGLDKRVRDIVELHELGHIKFNHVQIDWDSELEFIRNLSEKIIRSYPKYPAKYFNKGTCHKVMNISADIQVNSELLTDDDIQYMADKIGRLYDYRDFKVLPRLNFREYYEDVIKYLIEKSNYQHSPDIDQVSSIDSDYTRGNIGDSDDKSGNNPDDNDDDLGDTSTGGNAGDSDGNSDGNVDRDESSDTTSADDNSAGSDDKSGSDVGDSDDDKSCDDADDHNDSNSDTSDGDNHNSDSPSKSSGSTKSGRSNGIGNSGGSSTTTQLKNSDSFKEVSELFKSIFYRKFTGSHKLDSMKLKNRNCRPGSLLYNSVKRTRRVDESKPEVLVMIDVSPSMEVDTIIKIVSSLQKYKHLLDNNSSIGFYGCNLIKSVKLNSKLCSIPLGNGTDLGRSLKQVKSNPKIVIAISDFEDSLSNIRKSLKDGVDYYGICITKYDTRFYDTVAKVLCDNRYNHFNKIIPIY